MNKIPYPLSSVGNVSTQHRWSVGQGLVSRNALTAAAASTQWPQAERAILALFRVPEPVTVNRLWALNGATVRGAMDIGIYSFRTLERLTSTGSVAQGSANALTITSVTPVHLKPAAYYFALCLNTSGFVFSQSLVNSNTQYYGIADQTSAFPLPSSVSPIIMSAGFIVPVFGFMTYGTY